MTPFQTLFAKKKGIPLVLAPMAGVSDQPFRLLARRFGADLTVSEMIASQAMVRHVRRSLKMSSALEVEDPLAIQIAGNDPGVMAEAARMNVARGARVIDINMGCPVKKIVRNGGGAALLRDELLVGRILEAVVKAVPVPVSLKMRIGWDENSRNGPVIARIAQESGIAWLAIHGRTRAQMYGGRADWAAIGLIKARTALPVIGNGDITTPEEAARALAVSGVDGLMIGRGALGRPWIFGQVARHLEGVGPTPEPSLEERFQVAREHLESLLEFYGPEIGARMAKKQLAWYSRGLPGGAGFRSRINLAGDATSTREALEQFTGQTLNLHRPESP
ncbi:MAG: tRNA dihydrouridine synthase DusB [Magnetococcales bacterium]|nr:tRNA dihydrouridine synthase DusB [Magnetococcales bacterium]